MDKATALVSLKIFRQALEAQGIHVAQLILFGSHAKGTARPDSDIDTVVISEDFADKTHWQRIKILSQAIHVSNVLIEAVAVTPAEWDGGRLLIREYARDGEIVAA